MLQYMQDYKGQLTVNGLLYDNISSALKALESYKGNVTITINDKIDCESNYKVSAPSQQNTSTSTSDERIYKIQVRQYMTKPATIEFDFHTKWNNNIPMPLRVMVGKKLQETKGMVKMELHGAILEEQTTHCMKCGKTLTNPVSRYFGIGPECGGHSYTNPFDTEEELKSAVNSMKQKLEETKWVGWIIKSAIEECTIVEEQ